MSEFSIFLGTVLVVGVAVGLFISNWMQHHLQKKQKQMAEYEKERHGDDTIGGKCGRTIPEKGPAQHPAGGSDLRQEIPPPVGASGARTSSAPGGKPANGWYLNENGKITGPWTISDIEAKKKARQIDGRTCVWHESIPQWKELADCGIPSGPPPLSGTAVDNSTLGLLAFAPVWGEFACRILNGFIQIAVVEKFSGTAADKLIESISPGGTALTDMIRYAVAVMDTETFIGMVKAAAILTDMPEIPEMHFLAFGGWIVFFAINTALCLLDMQKVKKSGYLEKRVNPWWCFLVPVYIFLRAKTMKSGWWCFWVWIAALLLGSLLVQPMVEEFFKILFVR